MQQNKVFGLVQLRKGLISGEQKCDGLAIPASSACDMMSGNSGLHESRRVVKRGGSVSDS